MKDRKQTTGKTENNTVKLCPASHGTSGEGTVRIVNSISHSPQLRPGTILSIFRCLHVDKLFFDFYLYRMSIWSKYVPSLLANLQCLALGNLFVSAIKQIAAQWFQLTSKSSSQAVIVISKPEMYYLGYVLESSKRLCPHSGEGFLFC